MESGNPCIIIFLSGEASLHNWHNSKKHNYAMQSYYINTITLNHFYINVRELLDIVPHEVYTQFIIY